MVIKDALKIASDEFIKNNIENYYHETRELLAFVIGKTREWIMINLDNEISDDDLKVFNDLKMRRLSGEPLQYILGFQYFMGLKFNVNSSVLVPRADTEILVCEAYNLVKEKENVKILDLCTGSGCIAVSLAKEIKDSLVTASDISAEALKVAKQNAVDNFTKVRFIESDLFSNIPNEKFDLIVSNPPYITSEEMKGLSKDVLNEPHIALDGGDDGLRFYQDISKIAKNYLEKGGYLAFEIGYSQANDVVKIMSEAGYTDIFVKKDYGGNDRVIIGRM